MPDFVRLWTYLSSTPLVGLTTTLVVYSFAMAFYRRVRQAPWANPVLWSIVVLGAGLVLVDFPYENYFSGAQFIHFLLGPAVVALGLPLWERRRTLAEHWGRFALAALVGGAATAASAVFIGWALGLPADVLSSLAPKSATTPVAMGVAEQIGGVPALAALFAVLSGLVGAMSGGYLMRTMRMGDSRLDWIARGFAMGTVSHGIGAAHTLQIHDEAGAYAGLALGLQVLVISLLLPFAARLF